MRKELKPGDRCTIYSGCGPIITTDATYVGEVPIFHWKNSKTGEQGYGERSSLPECNWIGYTPDGVALDITVERYTDKVDGLSVRNGGDIIYHKKAIGDDGHIYIEMGGGIHIGADLTRDDLDKYNQFLNNQWGHGMIGNGGAK